MLLNFLGIRLSRLTLSVFAFSIALSGCGGGSSSSSSLTPTPVQTEFSISGSIQIPAGSLADKDILPVSTKLTPVNNVEASAQEITNPSSIGGYVSSSDGAYQGNSIIYDEDPTDIFSVSLLENQVVTLRAFPADPAINAPAQQTTLKLVRKSNSTMTGGTPSTADKALSVPADDDYFIHVTANEGPVLYLLTVSQGLVSTNLTASISSEFVPGEVMVKLKNPSTTFSVQGLAADPEQRKIQLNEGAKLALESIDGLSHKGGSAEHGMRMGIDLTTFRAFSTQTADLSGWPESAQKKWTTLQYIESLKQRDDIEWAEPNYIRRAMVITPTDPLYSSQWHYPLINLPAAWSASTGSGVVVAVIDTGIASNHADLAGNLFADGYDFISSAAVAGDGNGIDDNPEDKGGSFHGSHVAGTIAAVEGNSKGGVGVAFSSKIMPLRALGIDGSGNDADIAQAILYAAQETNASPEIPSQMADIINLSLGGPGFSNSLQSAIDTAVSKGLIIIAAAGNENTSLPSYPAAFSNVISVSAVGQTKERAPYSNFGNTIDITAPGGNMQQDANGDGNVDGILSTVNASSYAWFQGTSMAAPHVAGVAALMKSVKPALNAAEFRSLLAVITDDLGVTGRDDLYGYGLINAAKAMTSLYQTIPTFLAVNPQSISFDSLGLSSQMTLGVGGSGTVKVTSVVDDADWLSVTPSSNVDANKIGTYIVSIDRSGKVIGTPYSATITVNYQIDAAVQTPKTISVLMTVPDPSKVATVGTLLVGLIERAKQEEAEKALENGDESVLIDIFRLQEATENQGAYSYSFPSIPAGDYYVFASTNMDQDGIVSDIGEAIGDYPVVGDPVLVKMVDTDLSGLNFTVGYLNVVEGLSLDAGTKATIVRKIPDSFLSDNRIAEPQSIQKQN